MNVVAVEGTHETMGFKLGCRLKEAIKHNVALREQAARAGGLEAGACSRLARDFADLSSPSSIRLMEGMSRGSGLPFRAIVGFNALQDIIAPEGCTTFAAVGKATPGGNGIILKNRDTGGNEAFSGPGYHKNREVNLIMTLKGEDGSVTVGVTVAGSTGYMMGLNNHGVAAACNFGQSREISHLPPKELYGISGRTQMLREGLECASARDAVNLALAKLAESPMGTPGILFYLDAGNIYVIEGSFKEFALSHTTDGAVYRSNHFVMLDHLNNEKAVSAICRKIRAGDLVGENMGRIDRKKLMEFSMDHQNGYSNSICRHSASPDDGATVSAAIMELNGENPEKSRISIALGSPCWAWTHEEGNVTFQMDGDPSTIPGSFMDGSAYIEHIREEPYSGTE